MAARIASVVEIPAVRKSCPKPKAPTMAPALPANTSTMRQKSKKIHSDLSSPNVPREGAQRNFCKAALIAFRA